MSGAFVQSWASNNVQSSGIEPERVEGGGRERDRGPRRPAIDMEASAMQDERTKGVREKVRFQGSRMAQDKI